MSRMWCPRCGGANETTAHVCSTLVPMPRPAPVSADYVRGRADALRDAQREIDQLRSAPADAYYKGLAEGAAAERARLRRIVEDIDSTGPPNGAVEDFRARLLEAIGR